MRASIQSRTRSRTPVSIGSIQSSKSRASGCPVGCTECDLLIRSVMAWSPTGPERSNARIPLCGLHHPETTPPSKVYHLPDGTKAAERLWCDGSGHPHGEPSGPQHGENTMKHLLIILSLFGGLFA